MPVDYKLRNLRRLFGEANFLRPVSKQSSTPSSSSSSQQQQTSKKINNNSGGIANPFFHQVAPRAIKGKAIAGHMYSIHLYEKQKMKLYYGGMKDKQFKRYVERARANRFDIDTHLLKLLELRLDTILYRTGFVKTPMQARQWIFHGHILINQSSVDCKGFTLSPGDILSIHDSFLSHAYIAQTQSAKFRLECPDINGNSSWILSNSNHTTTTTITGMIPWLEIDRSNLTAMLIRMPTVDELHAIKRAALLPFIRDANLNPHAAMRSYR